MLTCAGMVRIAVGMRRNEVTVDDVIARLILLSCLIMFKTDTEITGSL